MKRNKGDQIFFLSLLLNKANHSLEWVLVSPIPPEIQRWSPCIDNLDTGATSFFKGTWPFLQFTTGLKWLYSQISFFYSIFFSYPLLWKTNGVPPGNLARAQCAEIPSGSSESPAPLKLNEFAILDATLEPVAPILLKRNRPISQYLFFFLFPTEPSSLQDRTIIISWTLELPVFYLYFLSKF